MQTTAEVILDGLHRAMLLIAERAARRRRPTLAVDATGQPVFHGVRDKLGDLMRVYRGSSIPSRLRSTYSGADLRAIRAQKGVGRPSMSGWAKAPERYIAVTAEEHPLAAACLEHGSQRSAAKALGLNLSTFQRRLVKEAA